MKVFNRFSYVCRKTWSLYGLTLNLRAMSQSELCNTESEESSTPTSSESDTGEMGSSSRKKRRISWYKNFVSGTARSVYKVRSKELGKSLQLSSSLEGVCQSFASGLSGIAAGSCKLSQQETELKKRKSRLPHPKHPDRQHYRDINAQNEWLRGNVFDAMGNYMFCHDCIKKALKISSQWLTRQHEVKRKVFQQPVSQMKKNEVDEQKLTSFVLMPDSIDIAFKKWWSSLPGNHTVQVQYPYQQHGLCGCTSMTRLMQRENFSNLLTQIPNQMEED